jgi:hypothetical protein
LRGFFEYKLTGLGFVSNERIFLVLRQDAGEGEGEVLSTVSKF